MRRKIRRLSYIVLPLVWVAVACMSCGTAADDEQQVTEAYAVLLTADSLRAQGVLMDDSIALARAVTTLGSHQRSHADDYVRACYYYGCLLRKRNNQTAAMQTFINAIHTENEEHTILGQVYCNMGIICYQEGDFQLAYEMHTLSARQHKLAKDSVRYNYALYEMAYALMKQRKKDSVMLVLADIEHNTSDAYTLSLVNLTKASLYRDLQQYDSALYYAGRELELNPQEGTGLMVKAQSFSMLNMKDSAVFYAKLAKTRTSSWDNLINIYYILAHDDNTIDENTRQQYHADRADIQTLTKQRQGRLAQAVMLLQQDMDRKPYFVNHIYLLFFLFFIIVVWLVAAIIIRKKHAKSAKDIEKQRLQLKEDQQVIISQNTRIKEKSERLKNEYNEHINGIIQELERNINTLMKSENWQKETEWDDYDRFCETANRNFFMIADKLKAKKVLSEKEIRLCILVMIGCFNSRQIARLICYAESGIRNYKQRIAKKLGISSKDLRTYLLSLAVGESISGNWDENIHALKNKNADL